MGELKSVFFLFVSFSFEKLIRKNVVDVARLTQRYCAGERGSVG